MIFALWRILAKVGMHDWAIFIPVYNVYCLFKLAFEDALVSMLLYIGFGFLGNASRYGILACHTVYSWCFSDMHGSAVHWIGI